VVGVSITCQNLDAFAEEITALQIVTAAKEKSAHDYYESLKLACRCRDAAIAFGVVAWYLLQRKMFFANKIRVLWSISLALVCINLYNELRYEKTQNEGTDGHALETYGGDQVPTGLQPDVPIPDDETDAPQPAMAATAEI
jgi:hypothetical protein